MHAQPSLFPADLASRAPWFDADAAPIAAAGGQRCFHVNIGELRVGARYVSQAVPSLLRLMGACVADYADIEVVVAGGGNMLEACSARFQIGQQNIDAAQKHLRLHGLHVRFAEVGGKCGRTLTVDCATQEVRVSAIQKPARVVHHA